MIDLSVQSFDKYMSKLCFPQKCNYLGFFFLLYLGFWLLIGQTSNLKTKYWNLGEHIDTFSPFSDSLYIEKVEKYRCSFKLIFGYSVK